MGLSNRGKKKFKDPAVKQPHLTFLSLHSRGASLK